MDTLSKTHSKLQKKINRLKKEVKEFQSLSLQRRNQIRQFHSLCNYLLTKKKVTKEELKLFIKRKPKPWKQV